MTILRHPLTRRRFVASTSAALAGAALPAPAAFSTEGRPLHAGVGVEVVTPEVGTFLIGPMAASTGVHDDLFARVLVLDDGALRAAFVALDYLGFDLPYTEELLRAVARGARVPVEHVFLNCSHTHSAPLSVQWGPWRKHRAEAFYQWLPSRLAAAAAKAAQQLEPVTVRLHRAPVQVGVNRRLRHRGRAVMAPNPSGPIVPWVDVLVFARAEGPPLAAVFAHAAHPVVVHGASTLISGDFPGFAVKRLEEALPPGTTWMFAQGCAGDINGTPLRGGLEAAKAAGRDLGNAVVRALELEPLARLAPPLRVATLPLELPLRAAPPVAEIAQKLAAEKDPERRQRFERLLSVAQRGGPAPVPCPLRALALGDAFCLATQPHEPFAAFDARIAAATGFPHAMVLGYTNGLECYLATEDEFLLGENGGYEASPYGAAFMYERSLPLAPSAEQAVLAAWRQLGRTLRA
jgi:neutral ceramidase